MIAKLPIEGLRLRRDVPGQRHQLPVDALAEPVRARDAVGVASAEHVDHAGARARFLVRDSDVAGGSQRDLVERLFALERLRPDDGGAALRVERDHLETGLDVPAHVLDRREASPRHDLLDVLRLVELLLDRRVATLPVGDRDVLRQRVVRRDVRERASECDRGHRVVRGHLDDRVTPRDRVADQRDRGNEPAVASRHVHRTRTEGADAHLPSVTQRSRDPSLEMVDADARLGQLPDRLAVERVGQRHVAVLQHGRRVVRCDEPGFVGLAHVAVLVEIERLAQRLEHVEDLVERDLVEIGERHRVAERKPVDVPGRVRSLEGAPAPAPTELDPVGFDHLAPQDHRNTEGTHHSTPFRNSRASSWTSCVALHVMRSSSIPCFSL